MKLATRVAIVDEHPVTRLGLSRMIDEQPDLCSVGDTDSTVEAMRLISEHSPDVVTIGHSLVDGNGLELARDLRERFDGLGIVILTARTEDEMLFQALEVGASAFVRKRADVAEVLAAIRHAAVASSSFSASGLAAALHRRQVTAQRCPLSMRERQVLALLQAGSSVPALAAELYISVSTAKTYVARLYEKLSANNRAQALMAAVRLGLIDEVPSPGLVVPA